MYLVLSYFPTYFQSSVTYVFIGHRDEWKRASRYSIAFVFFSFVSFDFRPSATALLFHNQTLMTLLFVFALCFSPRVFRRVFRPVLLVPFCSALRVFSDHLCYCT
jgi:glucan phosphoethanolaminetransferase (alkaline phosphatase superfamily)